MTLRTQNLKEDLFKEKHAVELDRAKIVTESYKETEGEPIILRRAKAIKSFLERKPIYISDHELLVGTINCKPNGISLYPEYSVDWILGNLESFREGKIRIRLEDEGELVSTLNYWKGKTVYDMINPWFSELERNAMDARLFMHSSTVDGVGRIIAGYDRVIKYGLLGIVEKMKELKKSFSKAGEKNRYYKELFYDAVLLVLEGAMALGKRYANKAEEVMNSVEYPQRKEELKRISEVCRRVPAHPASSFYEALQSFLFCHLIIQMESNGHGIGIGRFDQYVHPYYEKDLKEGRITREEAIELLECLWIKLAGISKVRKSGMHQAAREGGVSGTMFQNLTIVGQDSKGGDATNELSHLILESMKNIRVIQPSISLRFHNKINSGLLLKAVELLKTGIGMPAFFNDNNTIPILLKNGTPFEEARNHAIVGCIYPTIAGKTRHDVSPGILNMAKCLEMALNNGFDPVTKKKIGVESGDPRKFHSFEELLEAFQKQLFFSLHLLTKPWRIIEAIYREKVPSLFCSTLVDDCLEKGMTIEEGGARYNHAMLPETGNANVADSLAAIKWLVFDKRELDIDTLLKALDANFKGYESLRKLLLGLPKYGNDDNYVDSIFVTTANMFAEEVRKHSNIFGETFLPIFGVANWHWPAGEKVGALPDGRLAEEPLADGGISPHYGRDTKGPTATIMSGTKVDHASTGGTLLNLKFIPSTLKNSESQRKFLQVIKTYFDLGGHHVQFNIVDAQTLIEAQKEPARYKDLIVRVAGYSSYFTELSRNVQNEIITRTGHSV